MGGPGGGLRSDEGVIPLLPGPSFEESAAGALMGAITLPSSLLGRSRGSVGRIFGGGAAVCALCAGTMFDEAEGKLAAGTELFAPIGSCGIPTFPWGGNFRSGFLFIPSSRFAGE
jgi:hypothetical protein